MISSPNILCLESAVPIASVIVFKLSNIKSYIMCMLQVRLPMSNAEALVAKAHEWIDQVGHELGWDENNTKSRKGEYVAKTVFPLFVSRRLQILCVKAYRPSVDSKIY